MSNKSAFRQALSELMPGGVKPVGEDSFDKPQAAEAAIVAEPVTAANAEVVATKNAPVSKPQAPQAPDALTVIATGAMVVGNLVVDGSAQIDGYLKGDIECSGFLTINGKITGGSKTGEIDVKSARVEGSIESKGGVTIRQGAVVIGNVNGQSMKLFGAIKGNLLLSGHLTVGSTAVVVGDIRAASIDVQNGAVIDGHVIAQSNNKVGNLFDTVKDNK